MQRRYKLCRIFLLQLQGSAIYRCFARWAMSGITIREATDADKLAVNRWLNPQGDPISALQRNLNVTDWVAHWRGYYSGYVQLVRHPSEHAPYVGHWLSGLFIKSYSQGCGVGQALSQTVIERARADNAPTLDLLVFEDNVRAIRLYKKLGFKRHTILELEALLECERALSGRRRVMMRKWLGTKE